MKKTRQSQAQHVPIALEMFERDSKSEQPGEMAGPGSRTDGEGARRYETHSKPRPLDRFVNPHGEGRCLHWTDETDLRLRLIWSRAKQAPMVTAIGRSARCERTPDESCNAFCLESEFGHPTTVKPQPVDPAGEGNHGIAEVAPRQHLPRLMLLALKTKTGPTARRASHKRLVW